MSGKDLYEKARRLEAPIGMPWAWLTPELREFWENLANALPKPVYESSMR